jgi:hypothetical protein
MKCHHLKAGCGRGSGCLPAILLLASTEPRLTLPKYLRPFGTALRWDGIAMMALALNLSVLADFAACAPYGGRVKDRPYVSLGVISGLQRYKEKNCCGNN